jgi:hypothetical protein
MESLEKYVLRLSESNYVLLIHALGWIFVLTLLLLEISTRSNFFRAIDVVVGSLLSLFLVLLYRKQAQTLDSQHDLQEEQIKLRKTGFEPDVSINNCSVDCGQRVPRIYTQVTNSGDGPASQFSLTIRTTIHGNDELQGESTDRPYVIGTDKEQLSGFSLSPGETKNIEWPFLLKIKDTENNEDHLLNGHEMIEALSAHGVHSITISIKVHYRDQFGEESAAMGTTYSDLFSVSLSIDPDSILADDLLEHIEEAFKRANSGLK